MKNLYLIPVLILINYGLLSQDNYYWVGGSGNWSDLIHWQLDNGSTPLSLPYEINPVIFNENSFIEEDDYVIIDISNVYCKDMTWENIPYNVWIMGGDTSILRIFGSLKFHENVLNGFDGKFIFDGVIENSKTENTIELNGFAFNNAIFFNGVGGEWSLMDDLLMSEVALLENTGVIYLEHGSLNTNGHEIHCSSILSDYVNPRTLNIENSLIKLNIEEDTAWLFNAENLVLNAENSFIFIEGDQVYFQNKNGNEIEFGSIWAMGVLDTISNVQNQVTYQSLHLEGVYCIVGENIIVDSLIVNGEYCSVEGEAEIGNLIVNANQFTLPEGMYIKRLISNDHIVISGSNYIEYGRFSGFVYFLGNNTFDTLIMEPPPSISGSMGSHFLFESGTTQTINDSLFLRGHQCSNVHIESDSLYPYPELAYIRKDYGEHDVYCNFLHIDNVAAQSETLNFYAGNNSTVYPDPNDPPPGWIFENDTSSFFGWQGEIVEGCWGEPVILDASVFEGWIDTEYYWNGSPISGDITFEVTEPDTVSLLVVYAEECYLEDSVIIVFDTCESSINDELYDSKIRLYPNPGNGKIIS